MIASPILGAAMSERQLMSHVLAMARALGWLAYHPHSSLRSEEGYPDVTLCRNGVTRFWELKSETGRLTPAQARWGEALGASWACYRPRDLLSGEIEKALRCGD